MANGGRCAPFVVSKPAVVRTLKLASVLTFENLHITQPIVPCRHSTINQDLLKSWLNSALQGFTYQAASTKPAALELGIIPFKNIQYANTFYMQSSIFFIIHCILTPLH